MTLTWYCELKPVFRTLHTAQFRVGQKKEFDYRNVVQFYYNKKTRSFLSISYTIKRPRVRTLLPLKVGQCENKMKKMLERPFSKYCMESGLVFIAQYKLGSSFKGTTFSGLLRPNGKRYRKCKTSFKANEIAELFIENYRYY